MATAILSEQTIREAHEMARQARTWSRGRSKVNGREFWVIPSRSEATVAHYTTNYGCTCRGARRRGDCAHQEAVRVHEAQRVVTLREMRTLYPPCAGGCGNLADDGRQFCSDCAATRERQERMAAARRRVMAEVMG